MGFGPLLKEERKLLGILLLLSWGIVGSSYLHKEMLHLFEDYHHIVVEKQ
eukprot:CAMPEP_0176446510 /NCGR_PEP_ID=MMETSP0127-20121128/24373_1 /TAXON_ID=938130 /ORGANISM="Platyophrya macrostoma, Strain WH" /LENGTH=49 /DNA_ID= /DNA_START= /DNA_END= /DNA_ORIENTATION=